jgi:hypothetical protein
MSFWEQLASLPLAILVKESPWVYPLLETVHVLGLGLLFGGIFMLDLRLLGMSRALPMRLVAHHLLPWVWLGFALNVTTGILMFLSAAPDFAENWSFRAKIALIALAGLNMALFHRGSYRTVDGWDLDAPTPMSAKTAAFMSILLWTAIIVAGRMMAFTL